MPHIWILKRSISTTVAGLLLVGLLSPANAAYRRGAVSIFPDLPINKTADQASIVLTSRLPWLAPVGHRQPRPGAVPQQESVSAWERQQLQFDRELDRKLIICRGC
jgi:hypothetical protein